MKIGSITLEPVHCTAFNSSYVEYEKKDLVDDTFKSAA